MTPARRLDALLDRLAVHAGDVVYLHTSFSRMAHLGLDAGAFLDRLCDRLGSQGTLILPSFAWNLDRNARPWKGYADYYRHRPTFDVRHTPANIGWVPELFRTRPGVRRSADYWWPVCAWGRLADEVTTGQEHVGHPFGPGSAFDRLHQHGVKILGLGVTLNTSSLALLADFALGDDHPHAVFSDVPQTGVVIDHAGNRVDVRAYWLRPEVVRLIKPGALVEASDRFRAAVRRADEGETIQFCYPYAAYHEEAVRLGREAAARGQPVPWLRDYPLLCRQGDKETRRQGEETGGGRSRSRETSDRSGTEVSRLQLRRGGPPLLVTLSPCHASGRG
jgi:aminoglycoside N3'-acetyltransferase